jgi:hypothetical protein
MKNVILIFAVLYGCREATAQECSFKQSEARATWLGQNQMLTAPAWETVQQVCIEHGKKSSTCNLAARFWGKLNASIQTRESLDAQLAALPPDSAACMPPSSDGPSGIALLLNKIDAFGGVVGALVVETLARKQLVEVCQTGKEGECIAGKKILAAISSALREKRQALEHAEKAVNEFTGKLRSDAARIRSEAMQMQPPP